MNDRDSKLVAQQLGKPEGKLAIHVGKRMNVGNFQINMHAVEALQATGNDYILEIGMGNGFFLKDIIAGNDRLKYLGCDYSPEMVEESTLMNPQYIKNGQAVYEVGDAHNLPYDDNQFDKIITVNTLYFWEDHLQVIKELRRVLKPYGKIVFGIRPKSILETYPIADYINKYSPEELAAILVDHGFAITQSYVKEVSGLDFEEFEIRDVFAIVSATLMK